MTDSLVQELQQKAEETEQLQLELQMLETERVRLSLVEEKLLDVLQLLQHLRDLVSRPSGISPSSFICTALPARRSGTTCGAVGNNTTRARCCFKWRTSSEGGCVWMFKLILGIEPEKLSRI